MSSSAESPFVVQATPAALLRASSRNLAQHGLTGARIERISRKIEDFQVGKQQEYREREPRLAG